MSRSNRVEGECERVVGERERPPRERERERNEACVFPAFSWRGDFRRTTLNLIIEADSTVTE